MKKEMKMFLNICKKGQMSLKIWLYDQLEKYYKKENLFYGDGYILAKGSDILLTAHMDTVHKKQCKYISIKRNKKNKCCLTSIDGIGGDDRCGIWIIMQILTTTGFQPTILFCEDEEIGGVGSEKFIKGKHLKEIQSVKYMIELDRANEKDAVFYDCGNKEFQKYIQEKTGYKKAYGSFSDISNLSPKTDIASVNLSCGYYNAHTTKEYVLFEEMKHTLDVVKMLLKDEENVKQFDYQEMVYPPTYYGKYGYYGYYGYYDEYDDYYCGYYDRKQRKNDKQIEFYIDYYLENELCEQQYLAKSKYEALGMFFEDFDWLCFKDIEGIYSENGIEQ